MSKITGIVTEIFEGKVSKGKFKGDPFFTITLDTGEKLSTFGKDGYKFIEAVEEGNKATFEVEKSTGINPQTGEPYINITGETEIDVAYVGNDNSPGVVPKNTERYYKNRISALSAAVDYVSAVGAGTLSDKDLMDYANKFFAWING